MTSSKGLAVLLAAALFASGLAVGALAAHMFYAQKIFGHGGPPMPVGPRFEGWLEHSLDLTAEQRREVGAILERSRREADELRLEMGPRLRRMNRRTVEDISQVLTPEQRERFEEHMARWDRRQRRFGPGRGPALGEGLGGDRRPPAREVP